MRWPEQIPAGSKSNQLITLTDILATTAGFFGKPLPDTAGVDSFDLSSIMKGNNISSPIRTHALLQTKRGTMAFRKGKWKIRFTKPPVWSAQTVILPKVPCELYDLENDPSEKQDLSGILPEKVDVMKAQLLKIIQEGQSRLSKN